MAPSVVDGHLSCEYSNYMRARSTAVKIVPIGNSRGIRIPKAILVKYGFKDSVILEEHAGGAMLKSSTDKRLSWRETYAAAAAEQARSGSDWEAFDGTLSDGLDVLPW
jgi:antitoxin MazE